MMGIKPFEDGPRLVDDGAAIMVPSPYYSKCLATILAAKGFRFQPHDVGGDWYRKTSQKLNGTRYTPQAWLKWSIRQYTELFPKYNKKGE